MIRFLIAAALLPLPARAQDVQSHAPLPVDIAPGVIDEGGGGNPQEFTPITTLESFSFIDGAIQLQWRRPFGTNGMYERYAVYHSTQGPITMATQHQATLLAEEETPFPPGGIENCVVEGVVAPHGLNHFAVTYYITSGGVEVQIEFSNNVVYDIDLIPPSPIDDLVATPTSHSSVRLDWTATGDDGMSGRAFTYQIRSSTLPPGADVEEWWVTVATPVGDPSPDPADPLAPQSLEITNLPSSTRHYFAIRVTDVYHLSAVSNIVQASTPLRGHSTSSEGAVSGCSALGSESGLLALLLAGLVARRSACSR